MSDRQPLSERLGSLPQLMLGMIALAIGLVLAANAISAGLESRNPRDKIVVAGSARRPVEANQVKWRLSLTSRQPTSQETIAELNGWFKQIDAFMKDQGITKREITVAPVELNRTYETNDSGNEVPVGFVATRSLRVSSTHLDRVQAMARNSDALIAEGVPIEAGSPEFVYTKLAEHRRDMVREAAEDAKKRAETLAKVGGARLGRVKNVEVGSFQVTSRGGTNFESGGTFDRASRHKDIVLVVHLTFELR